MVCPGRLHSLEENGERQAALLLQRPHDGSCLSVVSFNSTIRRSSITGYFGFRFTAVYN